MKKRAMIGISAVLAFLLLWSAFWKPPGVVRESSSAGRPANKPLSMGGDPEPFPLRTRSGERIAAPPRPTHYPDQLPEFMLPDVAIDGLTLSEALQKLNAAYEEACLATGENPVALRFVLPIALGSKLHLRLGARDVDSSIRLLAAVSGLKVVRVGSEYRFKNPEDSGKVVEREISSKFLSFVSELEELREGSGTVAAAELTDRLAMLGVRLDPATRFITDSSGKLKMETSRSADETIISGLAEVAERSQQTQH